MLDLLPEPVASMIEFFLAGRKKCRWFSAIHLIGWSRRVCAVHGFHAAPDLAQGGFGKLGAKMWYIVVGLIQGRRRSLASHGFHSHDTTFKAARPRVSSSLEVLFMYRGVYLHHDFTRLNSSVLSRSQPMKSGYFPSVKPLKVERRENVCRVCACV